MRRLTVNDGEAFVRGLYAVLRAASKDETKPSLTAIRVQPEEDGGLLLVATDTHRLAFARLPAAAVGWRRNLRPFHIQARALRRDLRVSHASVERLDFEGEDLVFAGDSELLLSTPLVETDCYPDWSRIPKDSFAGSVRCVADDMEATIRDLREHKPEAERLTFEFGSGKSRRVGIVCEEWGEERSSKPIATHRRYVEASIRLGEGAARAICLNSQYLLDGLRPLRGEVARLRFDGKLDVFRLDGGPGSWFEWYQMPMQR